MPLDPTNNRPSQRQSALLIKNAYDQGRTAATNRASVDHQNQRTGRQTRQECPHVGQEVSLWLDPLVLETTRIPLHTAFTPVAVRSFRRNGSQIAAAATHDTA